MLIFDTSATSFGAKASIAITLCSFGVFTTGTPPYSLLPEFPCSHRRRAPASGIFGLLVGERRLHSGDDSAACHRNNTNEHLHVFSEFAVAGLLHWFTSPYVRRLVFDKRSNTMEIETLSILAQPQISRAHLAEITYPDTVRPQVTFAVSRFLLPAIAVRKQAS